MSQPSQPSNQPSASQKDKVGNWLGAAFWGVVVIVFLANTFFKKGPDKATDAKPPSVASPASRPVTSTTQSTPVYQPRVPVADQYEREQQQRLAQQRQANQQVAQFTQQLMQAAMEEAAARQQAQRAQQEQQYQRFNQQVQSAQVCRACGGAGDYRFVDGAGNLQVRQCPRCNGSGRNW